jgi:arylsulfatase A-like enzyme
VAKTRIMTGRPIDTTPTVVAQLASLYDANVRIGDVGFGRLLAHLKRRQLLPRTVVVVGADHGESLGEHGIVGPNNLWRAMLHVPLVVHVPGTRGRRIDAPVMNVDVVPTNARLVGAPLAQPVRGRDLLEPIEADRVRMAEYSDHYAVVRNGRKLHVRIWPQGSVPDGLWELSTDPAEEIDLMAKRPGLTAELSRLGEELRKSRLAAEPARRPEDIFDRLRALGYVEDDPAVER